MDREAWGNAKEAYMFLKMYPDELEHFEGADAETITHGMAVIETLQAYKRDSLRRMEFRPLLGFIGEWLDEMGFEKQKLIWDAIINSAEEAVEKAHGKITALDLFPDPLEEVIMFLKKTADMSLHVVESAKELTLVVEACFDEKEKLLSGSEHRSSSACQRAFHSQETVDTVYDDLGRRLLEVSARLQSAKRKYFDETDPVKNSELLLSLGVPAALIEA